MSVIANTPKAPYYAVIFTSTLTDNIEGYDDMADKILELATQQPGFLGFESAREDIGISISYWKDLHSISHWKANLEHLKAQKIGHEKWYSTFKVRVSRVERDYGQ